ncbi:MAG: FkbM family methyltransferase [Loktanella sp.]|nr:FkbM family methyltransferase [Loktanella sp.]
MKTVFLVRCHAFDVGARHVANSLSEAGAQVVMVVDERRAVADTGSFAKISITDQVLADLDLTGLPENWGWLCGDVWYYVAAPHFPDATHLCLVESDVAFAGDAAAQFVQAMLDDPTDLLAAELGAFPATPKYSKGLATLGRDTLVGCYFPVTRCSAGAITRMFDLRRESIAKGVSHTLNDEAVLASVAHAEDFSFQSLNELLPDLFRRKNFYTNPPNLLEAILRGDTTTAVFHPAVPFDLVLARIYSPDKNYNRFRLRRILPVLNAEESNVLLARLEAKEQAEATLLQPVLPFALLARELGLHDPITVLDIGANPLTNGSAPYIALLQAGLAQVFGFEPQPDALAALNAGKSEMETYFPDAVGNGEPATLHLYHAQGFASLFKINEYSARYLNFGKWVEPVGEIALNTRKLDDIAEIPPVDLLKIDVQGAETQIIAHGRAKLAQALVVITEMRMFPIYQGEPRFGDLAAELHGQGFEFLRFAPLHHVPLTRRHRGNLRRSEFAQAVDGDAIFVRDLRNMATFDDESLKKLAVIADAVIDNADLTISILEQLEDRGVIPATLIPDYLSRLPADRRR